MSCSFPLQAFQCADGSVVFSERRGRDVVRSISLPCGQCTRCRLERSRQWAMRCLHEAQLSADNCFLTLTYRDEDLPERGQLKYEDFQLFMKRYRKAVSPVRPRFYMCGEYGEKDSRPHYHACIFGHDFKDRTPWKKTGSGSIIYRSAMLESLWKFGHSSIGELNFLTAGYVARYCMKKVTGRGAYEHYLRVDADTGELYSMVPEFTHMSLKPGIGARWFSKFLSDVFPGDYCVVNGKKVRPPKFYDRKYAADHPEEFESIQWQRELDAAVHAADNTPERLAVKEICADANVRRLLRSL